MNISKSVVFLYTNKKVEEREIKESIQFTIVAKRVKYPGINLIEPVKKLYFENYRTLMKKLKTTQTNGKICHAHGLKELIMLKCSYYPSLQIPCKFC